jgi:hypothetical protein
VKKQPEGGFLAALRGLLRGKPKQPPLAGMQRASSRIGLPDLPRGAEVRYFKVRRISRVTAVEDIKGKRRRKIILGSIAASIVLLPILAWVLIALLYQTSIPPELHGTWRTEEPRYASRRFELLVDQVVFQVGEDAGNVERHVVSRVRRSRSARGPLYRVQYTGSDGELYQFSFTFENGVIRFENQPDFSWNRTGPPSPRPRVGEL